MPPCGRQFSLALLALRRPDQDAYTVRVWWCYIFYAEFIALSKPSIKYKKTLVSAFNKWKIHGEKAGSPSPQKPVQLQGE